MKLGNDVFLFYEVAKFILKFAQRKRYLYGKRITKQHVGNLELTCFAMIKKFGIK